MINKKIFFKGYKSILAHDSPAIALGCCFIAIGALLKNLGFNIQESIFSTMLTYALPGSLVMAESLLVGASLLNIFLAVWFVNARLYPMAVSLFPLMMHKNQPKWKYYFSCHFIAVSAWLIMKNNYKSIPKEQRIDYWIGIGSATWSVAVLGTFIGFHFSDLGNVFSQIINGAFNSSALFGGFIGVLIVGFTRAAFSNEAGVGSASIAHSAAKTKEPVSEGMVALLEPFIDTVVICTMTAIVIIITGNHTVGGLSGSELTTQAFGSIYKGFEYILAIAILLFAFSTMISWSYYGLKSWTFLFGKSKFSDISYKSIFL